jgi:hypothetical protein
MHSPRSFSVLSIVFTIIAVLVSPLHANHGPGASGGGAFTQSGETLKPGSFELSLREDFSKFQHISNAEAIARATRSDAFDDLDHGFLTSVDLTYGVVENLQIGANIGYFAGNEFLSADQTSPGVIETASTNPDGLTDLTLTAKYRFLQGQPGNLAVITGVILPTGRNNVRLNNGELLGPTDQPGGGRFGIPVGLGYSRFLTARITLDASVLYTHRFEKDNFQIGDRLDTGVAVAYRLTESIKQFPQFSVFAELNDVLLFQDQVNGIDDPQSGSNTIYLTPGARARFTPHAALTIAPSFPLIQDVNGDQGKVDFKLAVTLSFSF